MEKKGKKDLLTEFCLRNGIDDVSGFMFRFTLLTILTGGILLLVFLYVLPHLRKRDT